MTDIPDMSPLAHEILSLLEGLGERNSPKDVCRAAGWAIGNYLMGCTVTKPDMDCGNAYSAALVEATTQFGAAFAEAYIKEHGGRN